VARIRENPDFAGTAVIVLTSGQQPGDAARSRQLAVAAYLSKPVARSQLLTAIQRALGHASAKLERPIITPSSLRQPGPGVRILLAEDNKVNQRVAVRMLEKNGHRVVVAGNGREALAVLEREDFDLVLMDVQMPEMSGLEAAERIREKEGSSGRRLPIVAMTASAMLGDEEKCLQAGMDGYISKPVRAEELAALVETYTSGTSGAMKSSAITPIPK
jgi:two-component system, sensor histidine kinase and response regulator